MRRYKRFFIITSLTLITLILSGCGINVPDDKKDYIGVWVSDNHDSLIYLSIPKEGNIKYFYKTNNVEKELNLPLKSFDGDNFTIGALGMSTTFIVSQKPHLDNGVWKMTVDNRVFIQK